MADQEYTKPIVKFERLSIKGINLNPMQIIQLDIFESIDYPGLTGRLLMQDFNKIKELGDLFAGDSFHVTFGREKDAPLDLEFVITESYGDTPPADESHNIINFGFSSPWLIPGFTRKRSRPFVNKRIDEIVSELVTECGGIPGIMIPTKQTLERFVSPYVSPMATIRYLMNFATDENDNGGYLIWTDADSGNVNFIPIGVLMHGTDNYGTVGFDLTMNPRSERTPGRIFEQSVQQSFDIMRYGDIGAGRSRIIAFDYDNTKVMNADKRVDEYPHNHLSTRLPLNDKFLGRVFRPTRNSYLYPNTNDLISIRPSEFIDGRLSTKYSLLFSDILKIEASVPGEGVEKRAGRQVKLAYPSVADGKTDENKQYSGTYLIRNIRHMIQGMEYLNTVMLIADGFKEIQRSDMIDWDGQNNIYLAEYDGDEYDKDADNEIISERPSLINARFRDF